MDNKEQNLKMHNKEQNLCPVCKPDCHPSSTTLPVFMSSAV